MTNRLGFRPKLLRPQGRLLEHSYRPLVSCLVVSGCLAVLVGMVFGLIAFNIFSHRLGINEHRYHAGDEMSLRQAGSDLSPTFCFAYTVQPMGRTNFYLFPHQAELDPSETVPIAFRLTAEPRRQFVHTTHYLLVNSTVRLSACYHGNNGSTSDLQGREHDEHSPAMILVIVGDDHFQDWLKHYNMRHVRHTVLVPHNATCSDLPSMPTLALTVPDSDDYHFVLMSRHPPAALGDERGGDGTRYPIVHSMRHAPIDSPTPTPTIAVDSLFSVPPLEGQGNINTLVLSGSVNKTQFNLTGAEATCQAAWQTSCSFPLQWGSHPDVVAQVGPKSATPEDKEDEEEITREADAAPVSFVTRCDWRRNFWIPVFVGLPAVIIVFLWGWCWCLLVRRKDVRSRYRVVEPMSGGRGVRSRASYGSMNTESRAPLLEEVPDAAPVPLPTEHEVLVIECDEHCASIQG